MSAKSKAVKTDVKSEKEQQDKAKKDRVNLLLKQLNAKPARREQCRLRGQLRKLGHRGGTRTRVWYDANNKLQQPEVVAKIKTA